MIEGDDVSRILDILGNKNRRRILQLLRQKPCFVTEISERLTISPKAVIEHLQFMEREEILKSRGDINRRKYYYIFRDFSVMIDAGDSRFGLLSNDLRESGRRECTIHRLKMIRNMVLSRENLISDLEYLERDINKKISDLSASCKDILPSETEVNLVLALSNYEMSIKDIEEFILIPEDEVRIILNNLIKKGIVERKDDLYRVCDIFDE
ncbi:ArsR family transcriptional regulator [Methanoplanus sp. FWC-SCC4]|uniref:ArsR family transcriptional regulator n=1 Tax=Methanochimaera problematica TaxID=2609417 RepID=A0AA97I3N4_9EURY|nr:ArsR family transcriptional regulator [Methanoplanus sp. FWC-SCC4]WOF15421.1 ArsR family transcriptional regulator [Methanoplanus sp. FWC-SCC4]